MSIVIAVPTHPLFEPLITHAESVCKSIGARLLHGTEQECRAWLGRHIADVALVSPLGYAQVALKTDLRIVPVSTLTLDALTYTGSIYLHQHQADMQLSRCVSPVAEDFLMMMGRAVFAEKFDVELTFTQEQGSVADLLTHYDVVLDYGFDQTQSVVLDISDEWSDYFGEILPIAVWACRPEEVPETLAESLAAFRNTEVPPTIDIAEQEHLGANAHRIGMISTDWNEETEEALAHLMELLYYWQYTPSVAAIKIWMRDVVERV
ncbi:MAG: hypothetical protein ACOVSW_19355 [Candidatus Kapaibacteriota bacterium]